jgi:hypothetical protein
VTGPETHIAAAPAGSAAADDASDDALMLRYRCGDANAFDALYGRYRMPIYRFFRRQLPGPDADECHQEVWLKLINGHRQYRGESFAPICSPSRTTPSPTATVGR